MRDLTLSCKATPPLHEAVFRLKGGVFPVGYCRGQYPGQVGSGRLGKPPAVIAHSSKALTN